MITSSVQHHDEEEDLDMLRKIAMESLKRGRENEFSSQETQQTVQAQIVHAPPLYPAPVEPVHEFHNNAFAPVRHPPRIPGNPGFFRPRYGNNFIQRPPVRFVHHHRMSIVNHFPPQPVPIVPPEFQPIPHVNPQFLAQPQQPTPPQIFQPINEFPTDYVPTPTIRLSPRSAEFIAANAEAMKKASSKRYSRSPPPRRRRSRSKSPYKRRSPIENNRKRYRSKSPDSRVFKSRIASPPKSEKRSKSPRNRSQSPPRARYSRKGGNNKFNNGNGRYNNRKRSESDNEEEKVQSKEEPAKEKVEESPAVSQKVTEKVEKEKSPSPSTPEEKSTTPPLVEKKEKTQEEIEDELLASTDEEDGLDLIMDDNELDFLNDDSESENEGRFKSKPSTNVKSASLPSKSSYGSKSYDKGKYASSRHDYKRDDKYSSKRRKSPEPEVRKKSPNERKPIVLSKDKDDSKNGSESEKKSMFKSTFKSVDSSEKKAEPSASSKKSDSRVTLVRSFVSKPETEKKTSSVKSVITVNDDSSKTGSKKKIMDRLGEFVGVKGKNDGNRSRASKQVTERNIMVEMNRGGVSKGMASKKTYCTT